MFSSSTDINPIFSLVAIIFFFGLIGYGIYSNKKAKKEMLDYCKKNGISYHDKIINIPTEVRSFSFINIGDERTFDSIMSMNKQNKKIFIFSVIAHSYLYKDTKSLKHSRASGGTICLIVPNKPNTNATPSFYIRDKNNKSLYTSDEYKNLDSSKVYEKFGGTTISLTNNQSFSNKFMLMGHSKEEVEEFLTPEKTKYLLENHNEKYLYEAGNNSLMILSNTFYGLEGRLDMLKYSLKL